MAPPADEPTPGEILRGLTEIREELRALRSDLVRRDVYDAHRAEMDRRVQQIEEDRTALRRTVYGAILVAVLSVIVQIVTSQT